MTGKLSPVNDGQEPGPSAARQSHSPACCALAGDLLAALEDMTSLAQQVGRPDLEREWEELSRQVSSLVCPAKTQRAPSLDRTPENWLG